MDWVVSEGGEADHLVPTMGPLVGAAGSDFIAAQLGTRDPQEAVREIQRRGHVRDPRVAPRLGLLRALGQGQAESFKKVLGTATDRLLQMIPTLPQDRLELLLEASFPFIGIRELRTVPIRVLSHLRPVPLEYLKELAADEDLMDELPSAVQRQVWEVDSALLEKLVRPLLEDFPLEMATRMRVLDMDECLHPAGPFASSRKLPSLPRRMLRNGSAALRKLVGMVGDSPGVHRAICRFCATYFRDSPRELVAATDAAMCSLRAQLLLALHDRGVHMVTSADAVLPLCLAIDSSLQSRETSSRHLAAIQAFFHSFQRSPLRPAAPGEAPENGKRQLRVKFGAGAKRGRDGKPIESLDNPNQHALMDAAMVLRDPSSLYLILHEIHRSLLSAASSLAPAPSHPPSHHTPLVAPWDPWASTRLLFLTQLAQLALNAREMLREGRAVYMNPDADVVTQGYPALVALLGRVARGVDAGHWHGGLQAESSGGEAGFASGLARDVGDDTGASTRRAGPSTRGPSETGNGGGGEGAGPSMRCPPETGDGGGGEGAGPSTRGPSETGNGGGGEGVLPLEAENRGGVMRGEARGRDEGVAMTSVADWDRKNNGGATGGTGMRVVGGEGTRGGVGGEGGAETGEGAGEGAVEADRAPEAREGPPGLRGGGNGVAGLGAGPGHGDASGVVAATKEEMDAMSGPELISHLGRACVRSPVMLHVVFVASLERLAAVDMSASAGLLACLEDVMAELAVIVRGPLSDWAPFATTLAKRLHTLLATETLPPSDPLWRRAFEQLVIPCTHLDSQVHEEALRILLQLIGRIDPDELSALISLLLTSASRPAPSADLPHATSVRAQSVRAVGGAGASPAEAGSGSEDSDEADDGPTSAYRPKAPPPPEEGDEDAPRGKRGAPDGVRSIYAMIARKLALHGHTLEGELPELGRLLRRRKGERGEGGRGEGSGGIREAEGGAHGGG